MNSSPSDGALLLVISCVRGTIEISLCSESVKIQGQFASPAYVSDDRFGSFAPILPRVAHVWFGGNIGSLCDGAGVRSGATKLKPQKLAALDAVAEFK